jgi:type IV pilus assembly protein PilN
MRVRLNVATKAQKSNRRFLLGSGIVAVVGLIALLALGLHVYSVRSVDARLRAQTEATNAKIADLQAQRAELERFFQRPENAKLHDRAAFLNGLIDERSFNWTQMFMDLEHILPAGVRVVSIEPQQVKGRVEVKLVVGASTDEAKLKFLRALEDSKQFKSIELDREIIPVRTGPGMTDQKVIELKAVYSRS